MTPWSMGVRARVLPCGLWVGTFFLLFRSEEPGAPRSRGDNEMLMTWFLPLGSHCWKKPLEL